MINIQFNTWIVNNKYLTHQSKLSNSGNYISVNVHRFDFLQTNIWLAKPHNFKITLFLEFDHQTTTCEIYDFKK